MQFSLRSLMTAMFVIFVVLVLTVVVPPSWLSMLGQWLLQLAAVVLLLVVVYGHGRGRAFAVGGLSAIVVPWLAPSTSSALGGSISLGGQALSLVAGASLVMLFMSLIGKAIWIAGCGWLGIVISERLGRPKPPPLPGGGWRVEGHESPAKQDEHARQGDHAKTQRRREV